MNQKELLKSLYEDSRFKDVEINCIDGNLYAHKSILVVSGIEYFATLYNSSIGTEQHTNVIKIDLSMDMVDWLLKFAYGDYSVFDGKIDFKVMLDIYMVADRFQCKFALNRFRIRMENMHYLNIPDEYKLGFVDIFMKECLRFSLILEGSAPDTFCKILYDTGIPSSYMDKIFNFNRSKTYVRLLLEVFQDPRCTFEIFNNLYSYKYEIEPIVLASMFFRGFISPKTYTSLNLITIPGSIFPIMNVENVSKPEGPYELEIQIKLFSITCNIEMTNYSLHSSLVNCRPNQQTIITICSDVCQRVVVLNEEDEVVDMEYTKLIPSKDTLNWTIVGILH